MKKIIIFTIIILVALFLFTKKEESQENKKITLLTNSFPISDFTSKIGGERVRVVNLLPSGTEIYFFNPSLRDIADIKKADVFFYNGAGIEYWISSYFKEKPENFVDISSYFKLLDSPYYNEMQEDLYDPNFWLDPLIASEMGRIVLKELIALDPEGEIYYRENARKTAALFEELQTRYSNGLKDCEIRTVVVSRPSLAYLAKRYNLEIITVSGSFNIDRLSRQKMEELINTIKQKNIRYLFFETEKPSLLESIANETGTELLYFNPLSATPKKNSEKDYFSIMIENLEQLKVALACR
jgi:zinc transport system substrate-binding protein